VIQENRPMISFWRERLVTGASWKASVGGNWGRKIERNKRNIIR